MKRVLAFAAAVTLLGAACQAEDAPSSVMSTEFTPEGTLTFLRDDGSVHTTIDIELAVSPEEQAVGLMRRRSLPEKSGMLFVYDAPQPQRFWMKNTPMPLDFFFIRADSTVSSIVKRARPLSEAYIESEEPVQLVLEVRGGFIDRYGLDETARISWTSDRMTR